MADQKLVGRDESNIFQEPERFEFICQAFSSGKDVRRTVEEVGVRISTNVDLKLDRARPERNLTVRLVGINRWSSDLKSILDIIKFMGYSPLDLVETMALVSKNPSLPGKMTIVVLGNVSPGRYEAQEVPAFRIVDGQRRVDLVWTHLRPENPRLAVKPIKFGVPLRG